MFFLCGRQNIAFFSPILMLIALFVMHQTGACQLIQGNAALTWLQSCTDTHTHVALEQTGVTREKQRERHRCSAAFAQMKHLDCAERSREDKEERRELGVRNKRLIGVKKGGINVATLAHVQHHRACLIAATQRTRSALCYHPRLPLKSPAFVVHTQAQLSFWIQIGSVFFALASSLLFVILPQLLSPSSVN